MRNHVFFLALLLSCLGIVLSSCRKQVDHSFPPFESQPTVNTIFTVGDTIAVHVSLAQGMGDQALPYVEDASVRLFEDENYRCVLLPTGAGWYRAPLVAEGEKNYRLEVVVPGFDTLHCPLRTPQRQEVRRIGFSPHAGFDDEGVSIPGLQIQMTNRLLDSLYYQLIVWVSTSSPSEENFRPAAILQIDDPVLVNEGLPILVFSNEAMSDSLYTLGIRFTTGTFSSHPRPYYIRVELRSIDRDLYSYHKALYLYDRGRYDSFIGEVYPSYPIYSNVKNGYGLVSSMSRWVSSVFINTGSGVSDDGIIHYQ